MRKDNVSCTGWNIKKYSNLLEAQKACSLDNTCQCIYNDLCDGKRFRTSKGPQTTSSNLGSCAWTIGRSSWPCLAKTP